MMSPSGHAAAPARRAKMAPPMRKSYWKEWLVVAILAGGAAAWALAGRAWYRRVVLAPDPVPASSRTETRYLALKLPRITPRARPHAMSSAELAHLLSGLASRGYVSIGLDDAAALHSGERLLPPKSVLLVFAGDDPGGAALADRELKRRRMRGALFYTRAAADGDARKSFLTEHALRQMRLGGAWTFGRLDADGSLSAGRLRFAAADAALNDAADDPSALKVLPLRADRLRDETLALVDASWPRERALADDFVRPGFDPDWIQGWGVLGRGAGKLTMLPLPRQTGAGLFVRGSDQWRDVVVEFDLARRRREFWAYARYRGEAGYVRVGTRDGFWLVEQKLGPRNLPTMLARAPIVEDGRPARVRFVLKGDAAIVHVNGRMIFGKALHVHPRVARGRVMLGVYDARSRSALAVLTRFRAAPAPAEAIAFEEGAPRAGFDEGRLDALREAAALARAIVPRWLSVRRDGGVVVARQQETLIRSLAGFYGCRLLPTAELPQGGDLFRDPASARRLAGGLAAAARELEADGLNLRGRAADLERPAARRFLKDLRRELKADGRELWTTIDGPAVEPWTLPADSVLRPTGRDLPGYDLLAALPPRAAPKELASTR